MISLHDTLKLNNQAVALYHSNDLNQAAKAYYKSLRSVNKLLKECHDQDHHTAHGSPIISTSSAPQHEYFHSSTPRSHGTSDTIRYNDHEPFVYQGALIFQESPSSMHNLNAISIYCAGILFNTAILHHQEAIKTGNSAPLDRAAHLYEASLQIIGKIRMDANSTVSLIAIAASNNLAQIELAKGLLSQACNRLLVVKSLIHGLHHIVTDMFTMDEFNKIRSNTLSASGMIASAAA